jgi:hypothetical protein
LIDKWSGAAPAQIAELYAARGDLDAAFDWLDRGIEAHDAGVMEALPTTTFRPLHADPRWAKFLKRLNYEV